MKITLINNFIFFEIFFISTLSSVMAQTIQPGSIIKDCDVCPELVVIPKGSTSYSYEKDGKNIEGQIEISQPIAVGRYDVTRKEFEAYYKQARPWIKKVCYTRFVQYWEFRDGRYFLSPGFKQNDNHPAVCISWNEADAYVQWLSKKTGHHYRLLTMDEFDYLAHDGDVNKPLFKTENGNIHFCASGNFLDQTYAKLYKISRRFVKCSDGFVYTSPVGSFPPNGFGLYDLLGNVWEWTSDCQNRGRNKTIEEKRKCSMHVVMGGSFLNTPDSASDVLRAINHYGYHYSMIGFRVVRELAGQEKLKKMLN